MPDIEEALPGGNVAAACRIGQTVRRTAGPWSGPVAALLQHVRAKGLSCVPEPLGFDEQGRQVLTYIPGEVPGELLPWLWADSILDDAASMLRSWHDATVDYCAPGAAWGLAPRVPAEVICHNDFAPYNCVFRAQRLVALIDFDACAPGPRIWDIAYALYRFVPLYPPLVEPPGTVESSPFSWSETLERVRRFLESYSRGTENPLSTLSCLDTAVDRIRTLAVWTDAHSSRAGLPALHQHACMYRAHATWLEARVAAMRSTRRARSPS